MKKVILLLTLVIVMLFVSGCWSRRELNDISIVSALGIDKSGDQYTVSVQIINPSEISGKAAGGGGGFATPVTIHHETGKSIFEAIRRMSTKIPRKLYLSDVRVLVISEDLAKEGINKVIDFISRDHEFRTDFYIVIAKRTSAEQILKIITPLEKVPATQLFESLEMSERAWTATKKVKLDELITDLVAKGIEPVLPGIQILGDSSGGKSLDNVKKSELPTLLQYSDLAVFNKGKLVGWFNEQESKGYNYIKSAKSTVLNVSCSQKGEVGIELIRMDRKVKAKVENGRPKIDVEIRAEGNIGEVECNTDVSKLETIQDFEQETEQVIQNATAASVKKAKKLKSDVYGFGEAIHRSNPAVWKKLKETWDQDFVDLPVRVKVDVKIRRVGTITKPIYEE